MDPVIKWVGGKRQLLPEIKKLIPDDIQTYYEPFIGGAAVLLDLVPVNAVINDYNTELINMYKVIKNKHKKLIAALKVHAANNCEEYFYQIRNLDRTDAINSLSDVERAARIIYLNKTCYNGLYRVNSKNEYNTPYGKYVNPNICSEDAIIKLHNYFKNNNIIILNKDFEKAVKDAKAGDFVYFDPPYAPLSATSSFTGYSDKGFTAQDQLRLKQLCDKLTEKGVKFMLSNSSAPFILELYKDYNIKLVDASRAINSDATKRGKIKEVLVTNYEKCGQCME